MQVTFYNIKSIPTRQCDKLAKCWLYRQGDKVVFTDYPRNFADKADGEWIMRYVSQYPEEFSGCSIINLYETYFNSEAGYLEEGQYKILETIKLNKRKKYKFN